MARKVTFAEAELSVQRLFVGEKLDTARDSENGMPKPPEGVIVQIKRVLAPELESILSSILGDEECLSLVLTPACPRQRVSVWCADACILDASSVELLKKELTMASDTTRPDPPTSPSSEQDDGDEGEARRVQKGGEEERSKAHSPAASTLEELVTSFSHEVGNRLNAILMTAKLAALTLGRRESDIDELRSRLETVSHEAEVSGRLLKTLSRLSKRWRIPPGHYDLDELVRRWNETRKVDLPVDLHLCGNLPSLRLDPSSIETILDHLTRNAEEARAGRASVETEKRGDRARLIVRDDGPGIAPEHGGRIFDPFFSTRREEGALGLGLTLVQHMVDEHSGTIEVTSAPGEGTVARVELPLAEFGGDEG